MVALSLEAMTEYISYNITPMNLEQHVLHSNKPSNGSNINTILDYIHLVLYNTRSLCLIMFSVVCIVR